MKSERADSIRKRAQLTQSREFANGEIEENEYMSDLNGILEPNCMDAREQQLRDDYEWVLHDATVQQKYAGKVVIVHRHRILGAGSDHLAAMAEAKLNADCPPISDLAKVFVEGCPLVDLSK
ncbi:MAG TPA: hypothetical protein VGP68_00045 [Gemmataceae bacterium]|nr:hypothetical protein [Gemmataceae bacterium]